MKQKLLYVVLAVFCGCQDVKYNENVMKQYDLKGKVKSYYKAHYIQSGGLGADKLSMAGFNKGEGLSYVEFDMEGYALQRISYKSKGLITNPNIIIPLNYKQWEEKFTEYFHYNKKSKQLELSILCLMSDTIRKFAYKHYSDKSRLEIVLNTKSLGKDGKIKSSLDTGSYNIEKYNERGNIIEELVLLKSKNDTIPIKKYKYNIKNEIVEEIFFFDSPKNNDKYLVSHIVSYNKKLYNSNGDIVEEEITYKDFSEDSVKDSTIKTVKRYFSYIYDDNKNWVEKKVARSNTFADSTVINRYIRKIEYW